MLMPCAFCDQQTSSLDSRRGVLRIRMHVVSACFHMRIKPVQWATIIPHVLHILLSLMSLIFILLPSVTTAVVDL